MPSSSRPHADLTFFCTIVKRQSPIMYYSVTKQSFDLSFNRVPRVLPL